MEKEKNINNINTENDDLQDTEVCSIDELLEKIDNASKKRLKSKHSKKRFETSLFDAVSRSKKVADVKHVKSVKTSRTVNNNNEEIKPKNEKYFVNPEGIDDIEGTNNDYSYTENINLTTIYDNKIEVNDSGDNKGLSYIDIINSNDLSDKDISFSNLNDILDTSDKNITNENNSYFTHLSDSEPLIDESVDNESDVVINNEFTEKLFSATDHDVTSTEFRLEKPEDSEDGVNSKTDDESKDNLCSLSEEDEAEISELEKSSPKKKKKDVIPREKRSKKDIFLDIFDWIKVIVIAVLIALIINNCFIANAFIPSGSMESTIMTGDRIIGLRTSYWFSDPERGDIVIFKFPDDESKKYIKRVIGIPGDVVEIKDGKVYINGSIKPLDEPYLTVVPKGDFGPYYVPEGSYFMLGDNRNVSQDARYWKNTYVKKDKIIAKAVLRYYPKISAIKN